MAQLYKHHVGWEGIDKKGNKGDIRGIDNRDPVGKFYSFIEQQRPLYIECTKAQCQMYREIEDEGEQTEEKKVTIKLFRLRANVAPQFLFPWSLADDLWWLLVILINETENVPFVVICSEMTKMMMVKTVKRSRAR